MMTTGERIKAARKNAKLTQKELGAKLGIAYQTLAQWENDLRNPKYETLQKIASALEIDLSELLPDDRQQTVDDTLKLFGITDPYSQRLVAVTAERMEYEYSARRGYSFSEAEFSLIAAFSKLNEDGQKKAVERVEELTEIPKYQKE